MSTLHKKLDASILQLKKEARENIVATERYKDTRAFVDELLDIQKQGLKLNLGEHKGKSLLLIPSTSSDTGRRRMTVKQNSSGVLLINKHTGANSVSILPNKNYEVEATIENRGDIHMPAVNVEFFVSEKMKPHDVEFTCTRISVNFFGLQITGRLRRGSLSIGDALDIQGEDFTYTTTVNGIIKNNPSGTFHTINSSVGEVTLFLTLTKSLRTNFKKDIKVGDKLVNAEGVSADRLPFRMRVTDVFRISGRGTVVVGKVEQGSYNFSRRVRINVFTGLQNGKTRNQIGLTVSGKGRNNLPNVARTGDRTAFLIRTTKKSIKRGDIIMKTTREKFQVKRNKHIDSNDVKEQEFLGSLTTYLGAFDSKTVSIPWRAPSEKNRRDYIFSVRTYSIAPYDMPKNFDALDPSKERHVGVKKIPWQR